MADTRELLAFVCAGLPDDADVGKARDPVVGELLQLARHRYQLEEAASALCARGSPYQAALAHGVRELLGKLLQAAADLEADALEDPGITPYHARYHMRDYVVVLPAVARVASACLGPGATASGGGELLEALHAQTMTGDAAMKAVFTR
jgi:hypothetical protein